MKGKLLMLAIVLSLGSGCFAVVADMQVVDGGSGPLTFVGTLSHKTFPPTIWGFITQ